MRRLLLALALALSVVDGTIAQGPLRPRGLSGPGIDIAAVSKPTVTITSPSGTGAVSTNQSSIELGGTTQPGLDGAVVTRVTWSVSPGGQSGTATGTQTWSVVPAAGNVVKLLDTFDPPGANQDIVVAPHAPNIGGAYATFVALPGNYCRLLNSDGSVGANGSDSAGSKTLACEATPSSALSGTDYEIELIPLGFSGSASFSGAFFGGTDSSNYCVVGFKGAGSNPDAFIGDVVAGVRTIRSSTNIDPSATHTYTFVKSGTALSLKQDGVTVPGLSTTSSNCGGSKFGQIYGSALESAATIAAGHRYTSFKLTDTGATAPAIPLTLGANTITVTAEDANGHTNTTVLTATRTGGGDAIAPTVSILLPSSAGTWSDSATAQTISGSSADNVAVTSVTYSCSGATTLSGTATMPTATSWSQALTLSNGTTTCQVVAHDGTNDSAPAQIVFTINSLDSTPPAVTISTNGGANFGATTTPQPMTGTAFDAVGVTSCTYTNSLGGGGSASGSYPFTTGTWAFAADLQTAADSTPGTNIITVDCQDAAGNHNTSSITITYTAPLTITSPGTISAIDGQAGSFQMSYSGGPAGSPTWTNNGAGTTLNDGDADCTGTSINAAGLASFNHTGTGTCSWTAKITVGASNTTQAMSLVFGSSSNSGLAYFLGLTARGDYEKGYSLTPLVGHPCLTTTAAWCGDVYYSNQLYKKFTTPNAYITYDFAGDTHPHKQNAAKVSVPGWAPTPAGAVAAPVGAGDMTIQLSGEGTGLNITGGQLMRIGNEAIQLVSLKCATSTSTNCAFNTTTLVATVALRGAAGSTATSHIVGDSVYHPVSSIDTASQLQLPLSNINGNTVVFTWDAFFTDTMVNTGLGNWKWHNFRSSGGPSIFFEPNIGFTDASGSCSIPSSPSLTLATDVGEWRIRSYNNPIGTNNSGALADFTATSGNNIGPGTTENAPLCPMASTFIFKPNVWHRFWVRMQAVANDYDIVDVWVASETAGPTKTHSGLKISIERNQTTPETLARWDMEANTSTDLFRRNSACQPGPNLNCDLVHYTRGWAVLKAAGLAAAGTLNDAGMTALMARPVP